MTEKPKRPSQRTAPAAPLTLAILLASLEQPNGLAPSRQRDLRSAVRRVAVLLGNEPAAIALEMGEISAPRRDQPGRGGSNRQALSQHPLRLPGGRESQRCHAGEGRPQVTLEPRLG